MISIITAIHNQLDMNKLFWDYLVRYTKNEFELIIIDNNSTDGSREFFQSLGANVRVIANQENYSYPYCQNQGIEIAQYDVLAFLNNDLLVSPDWDERVMQVLGKDKRHVVSVGSNDRLCQRATTRSLANRWKRIKYPCIMLFGQKGYSLRLMRWLCYGNWERFTERIWKKYGTTTTDGFSGSAIIMNRKAIEILGLWDLSQQGADFDLFYRTCDRWEREGDLRPMATINGVFVHHYRRLTMYVNHPPFVDKDNLSTLDAKWPAQDLARWLRVVNFESDKI